MTNITLRRSPWRAPFAPLMPRDRDPFGTDLRRMLDTMFEPGFTPDTAALVPAADVIESPEEFTCTTELPGMKLKDVTVMFDNGLLTIKGEKMDEREKKEGKRLHVWERSFGSFERSFTFPSDVDAAKISAKFVDGVLTIHLPKTTEAKSNSRVISIAEK